MKRIIIAKRKRYYDAAQQSTHQRREQARQKVIALPNMEQDENAAS